MLYLGMRRKCCISAAACRIFALSQVLPQEALSPSELKNDMFRDIGNRCPNTLSLQFAM